MNKFEIRSKYLTNEEIDILAELEESGYLTKAGMPSSPDSTIAESIGISPKNGTAIALTPNLTKNHHAPPAPRRRTVPIRNESGNPPAIYPPRPITTRKSSNKPTRDATISVKSGSHV